MSSLLLDKNEPCVEELLRRLDNIDRILKQLTVSVRRTFQNDAFLTDSELSHLLKISRRTLQEYRTSGVIPYYLICGKVLYKASEIQQLLQSAYKGTLDEQRLV